MVVVVRLHITKSVADIVAKATNVIVFVDVTIANVVIVAIDVSTTNEWTKKVETIAEITC